MEASLLKIAICMHFLFGLVPADNINCSFSELDTCLYDYVLVDHNGLSWERGDGYLGYENNHHLDESPFGEFLYLDGTTEGESLDYWTEFSSPEFQFDGDGCLGFIYQDNWCDPYYAPQRKSFRVFLRPVTTNSTDILLREYMCASTREWFNEQIAIVADSGDYRLVFSGMQHEYSNYVIAVDHVQYTSQTCALQSAPSYVSGDCDFEGTDLCGYKAYYESAHEDLRWMTSRREALSHGKGSSGAPSGHFVILTWTDAGTFYPGSYSYVGLISPMITMNGEGCISLTYHNGIITDPGREPPALVLRKVSNPERYLPANGQIIHDFSSTSSSNWLRRYIPLERGSYVLVFEASVTYPYGKQENDVIGIDDIEIHGKSCDFVRPMSAPCDSGYCQNGRCVSTGIKRTTCQCHMGYFGRRCQYGTKRTASMLDSESAKERERPSSDDGRTVPNMFTSALSIIMSILLFKL